MSGSDGMWRLFEPWVGLITAVLAAGFAHQFGAEGMFDDCQRIGNGVLQLVAVLGIVSALIGGWLSFRIVRRVGESNARRVIAMASAGFAALAAFSTLLPLIASVTLPPCFQ